MPNVGPVPFVGAATLVSGAVSVCFGETITAGASAVLVAPGLFRIDVVVPEVPPGDVAVTAEIAGHQSQANVYLAVL